MAKGNFNPYEVLGITKDATEKDVQKAYKLQCLKWHPDKNRGNEEEAQRKFILAKEAFELLYDKERRAEHDKGVEATRVRDERQRERMEKSDEKRRKLMEELRAREKHFAQEERKPDELTPTQQAAKRKRDEKRVKSDFEDLARRLFKEAEEEMKAKNEQLNKSLAEHQKQKAASANTGKLRVKWPSEIILSDIALRKKFASYGTLVAISPIVDTKKKQKLCILEFESITDAGLKLDLSKDDKRLFKIDWKELPPRGGAKPAATPDVIVLNNKPPQSSQNFEQMSFAELMSHIDSKVNAPPPEKKSRP